MLDAGHRQMIRAAHGIDWRCNITNEEHYANSGLLPFSETIRKRRLCLIGHLLRLQNRSSTPFGSMLQNLSVVFSLRRGQGRTWTLAKHLLNDLNADDWNINDVINFSSSQFTRLVDSFNYNFHCWWTFIYINIIIIITMVIFKCYFSGEHISLSMKKKLRWEYRISIKQQIKSSVHDAN